MKTVRNTVFAAIAGVLLLALPAFADVNFGKDVVVGAGQTMESAVSFGGTVTVRGTVTDDAVSMGGDVIVEPGGKVLGDATAVGGNVIVRDGASVGHDAVTVGGTLQLAPTGSVGGEKVRATGCPGRSCSNIGKDIARVIFLGPFAGIFGAIGATILFFFFAARMLVWFGVAALFLHLFPARVGVMADTVRLNFWRALFYGIICLLLIPFLFLLLLVSLVGIPLIPLTALTLFLIYLYGSTGVAFWAGRLLPNAASRSGLLTLGLGVLVISLLRLVPGIGFLLWLLLTSISLGVALISRLGGTPPRSTAL